MLFCAEAIDACCVQCASQLEKEDNLNLGSAGRAKMRPRESTGNKDAIERQGVNEMHKRMTKKTGCAEDARNQETSDEGSKKDAVGRDRGAMPRTCERVWEKR